MFRRQPFDKVNPRNVLPSRHTLFIRGLPGSTDVGRVKEFFSVETNSKCSVDFFSTSDDKKRFSVAIRFKSHEMAKEMLLKYNNKPLLGYPVEMSWFKDLKKARAKMFEEQRQNGGRQFQRGNFRTNLRSGNDRRGIATSPDNSFDNSRRMRTGSSSSGGAAGYRGNAGRSRTSQSRSRSFTGSSSRSGSNSPQSRDRSHSQSRQILTQNSDDMMRGGMRGFSARQSGTFNEQAPRNQSCRSVSGSSSSTRSSPAMRNSTRASLDQKTQGMRYAHGRTGPSPLNYGHNSRRGQNIPASPASNSQSFSQFSNAPAPDVGGSSLVSGLIQLKRRQADPLANRHARRPSGDSSSSGGSPNSLRRARDNPSFNVMRQAGLGKRLHSLSPPLTNSSQQIYKQRKEEFSPNQNDEFEYSRRKKSKPVVLSPNSQSPSPRRNLYKLDSGNNERGISDSRRTPSLDRSASSAGKSRNEAVRGHRKSVEQPNRLPDSPANSPSNEIGRQTDVDHSAPRARSPLQPQWRSPDDADDRAEGKGWSHRAHHDAAAYPQRSKRNGSADEQSSGSESPGAPQPISKSTKINASEGQKNKESSAKRRARPKSGSSCGEGEKEATPTEGPDPIELIRQRKETLAQDYQRDCEAFTTVVRTLIRIHPVLIYPLTLLALHSNDFSSGTLHGG
ncbi:unnamed protein product [Calicophoron daubneyi]|uniref:RRM domain-containing protein n=1 Tax=Calicophoron daubneyi TaxID=300641 RepID=A0AAV2SWE6_CALDB